MKHAVLHAKLDPIRRRLQRRALLERATAGLAIGAGMACLLGPLRLVAADTAVRGLALAAMTIVPLVAVLCAGRGKGGLARAARMVDAHYGLQDRTLTAVALMERHDGSRAAAMQIDDAVAHLTSIDPAAVVETQLPSRWLEAVGLTTTAVCLLMWPLPEARPPRPVPRGMVASPTLSELRDVPASLGSASIRDAREYQCGTEPARPPVWLGKRGSIRRFFELTQSVPPPDAPRQR